MSTKQSFATAIPYSNFKNKYLIFILTKLLNIKTPKDFLELINNVLKHFYETTYIFEKDIKEIKQAIFYKYFNSVNNIQKIIIPNSVIIINDYAFNNFSKLEKIIISNSVSRIGIHAFSSCRYLKEVILGDNIIEIDSFAFEECWIKSITLPINLKRIGKYAFHRCINLTSVEFNTNLERIEFYAFKNSKYLKKVYVSKNTNTYNSFHDNTIIIRN